MAWQSGDLFELDEYDYVSHVVGSGAHKGNWKKYWMDKTGRKFPRVCQIYGCSKRAVVGAHVYVKHLHQIFILPSCQACNRDPDKKFDGTKECWIQTKLSALAVWVKRHENTYEPEKNTTTASSSQPPAGV